MDDMVLGEAASVVVTLGLYVDQPTDEDESSIAGPLAGGAASDVPLHLGEPSPGDVPEVRASATAPVHEVDHEP